MWGKDKRVLAGCLVAYVGRAIAQQVWVESAFSANKCESDFDPNQEGTQSMAKSTSKLRSAVSEVVSSLHKSIMGILHMQLPWHLISVSNLHCISCYTA